MSVSLGHRCCRCPWNLRSWVPLRFLELLVMGSTSNVVSIRALGASPAARRPEITVTTAMRQGCTWVVCECSCGSWSFCSGHCHVCCSLRSQTPLLLGTGVLSTVLTAGRVKVTVTTMVGAMSGSWVLLWLLEPLVMATATPAVSVENS